MIYGREKAKVPVTVINTPIMPKVGMEDDGKWQYVHKTLVDWVREQDKRTEQQILKEVIDWAIEHNIGTVYLIDEEFVKTALLNEIERRNKE
jgi:hypothetical protein